METTHLTRKDLREELGEFTEQVLLPAVERIVDDKVDQAVGMLRGEMGSLKSDMIDFVDRRISTSTGEIIATIKNDRQRDRLFKTKLVEVLKRNNLIREDEAMILEEAIP